MEAIAGLAGVLLGAALAPLLEWLREHRTRRNQHQRELLKLVAAFVGVTGDQLMAESSEPQTSTWSLEIGFRANAARWQLRLLAPPDVAAAADEYAKGLRCAPQTHPRGGRMGRYADRRGVGRLASGRGDADRHGEEPSRALVSG